MAPHTPLDETHMYGAETIPEKPQDQSSVHFAAQPRGRDTEIRSTEHTESPWCGDWVKHHADVVRYASYLLEGDTHAAEDIAQETALRLWQHPHVLRTGRPLAPWLRTVARNIVVDRHRRQKARPPEVTLDGAVDADGGEAALPRDAPHHDRALTEIESESTVDSILSSLSPRHRAAVVAVYVQDQAVDDAAARLGIPPGTVKSRCHTAVRQLRARFDHDLLGGLAPSA